MVRTQIQLTEDQSQALKRLASKEGKSVAELIRSSIDHMLRMKYVQDENEMRRRAIEAAGKLHSDEIDIAKEHDRYLAEAFTS